MGGGEDFLELFSMLFRSASLTEANIGEELNDLYKGPNY